MPEAVEVAAKIEPSFTLPCLDLGADEILVGHYGGPNGSIVRCVLLPGDKDPAPFEQQMAWAQSIGGDLPNRIEQALLFAFLKQDFQPRAYWSNELESDGWAWYQYFGIGHQSYNHTRSKLRARAVRRSVL